MKKPIIGISLDFVDVPNSQGYEYAQFPWYALRKNYADSVIKAGGIPIMIPYQEDSISNIIDLIDALIIPGGDVDIDPKLYSQKITSHKLILNNKRVDFEFKLLKAALERNMPFLGICLGMQLLNVLLGGNLIQYLPDSIVSDINHEQSAPKNLPTHYINLIDNSKIAKLTKERRIMVNSTHHQAVDQLGKNLIVAAIADDGVIEAIESTEYNFAVGVEWHPEYLNSELDLQLFKRLISTI